MFLQTFLFHYADELHLLDLVFTDDGEELLLWENRH